MLSASKRCSAQSSAALPTLAAITAHAMRVSVPGGRPPSRRLAAPAPQRPLSSAQSISRFAQLPPCTCRDQEDAAPRLPPTSAISSASTRMNASRSRTHRPSREMDGARRSGDLTLRRGGVRKKELSNSSCDAAGPSGSPAGLSAKVAGASASREERRGGDGGATIASSSALRRPAESSYSKDPSRESSMPAPAAVWPCRRARDRESPGPRVSGTPPPPAGAPSSRCCGGSGAFLIPRSLSRRGAKLGATVPTSG